MHTDVVKVGEIPPACEMNNGPNVWKYKEIYERAEKLPAGRALRVRAKSVKEALRTRQSLAQTGKKRGLVCILRGKDVYLTKEGK